MRLGLMNGPSTVGLHHVRSRDVRSPGDRAGGMDVALLFLRNSAGSKLELRVLLPGRK